jgi:hypothetical protein
MCWADNEILPASCTWVFPCMGIMQYNKSTTDKAKEDIKSALEALNSHLLTRTFLVRLFLVKNQYNLNGDKREIVALYYTSVVFRILAKFTIS